MRYFIEAERERDIADGFVPKSTNWEADLPWADVVVFDDTLGQEPRPRPCAKGEARRWRLSVHRPAGRRPLLRAGAAAEVGVGILPYKEFDNFTEAIEFVRANPDRYVIKPSGEAQNVKRRLFVGEDDDGEDVMRVLEAYRSPSPTRSRSSSSSAGVTGVEVAVGAFFNGQRFVYPINVNFEHKKLFPGTSALPPARWGRPCSGVAPTGSSTARLPRWKAGWPRRDTSDISTSTAS